MTETITIPIELSEIETPRGIFWAKFHLIVEVTGELHNTGCCELAAVETIDFANDDIEADDLDVDSRASWGEELAQVIQDDGLIDMEKIEREAIAEVQQIMDSRHEGFIEEMAR